MVVIILGYALGSIPIRLKFSDNEVYQQKKFETDWSFDCKRYKKNCDFLSFLKITVFQKKSCIGSLFCYRRYSILLLRVSPIDCVFCFLPSSYSSRCRMLRTRLLSINMTSVNGLNKAEPFDSLRYDLAGTSFIYSSANLSN